MESMFYHTVTAKKKGPHALGTVRQPQAPVPALIRAMPCSQKQVAREFSAPFQNQLSKDIFNLTGPTNNRALSAPGSVWVYRENLQPRRCLHRRTKTAKTFGSGRDTQRRRAW